MTKEQIRNNNKSLIQLSDALVGQACEVMITAKTEEGLRIGFENISSQTLS